MCNYVDKLTDTSSIKLLRQLESPLLEAFNKYKDCCASYALLIDENYDKYIDVDTNFRAQNQRVSSDIDKLNVLTSDAMRSEISKLELEIQRSESELQNTIMSSHSEQLVNKTVGHSLSSDDPMMTTHQQENENTCDNNLDDCTVIPPPPMFADVVTPKVGATLPKTSTPFVTPPNVNFTLPVTPETEKYSPKQDNDLVLIFLFNELCYAAEKNQVLQLSDIWQRYEELAKETGTEIPQCFVSRKTSFKEKLLENIGHLFKFEREPLFVPHRYSHDILAKQYYSGTDLYELLR